MVVGGSQQKTLDLGFVLLGTRQQGVLVILWELMTPDGLNPVSPSFTVRDVTTELSKLPVVNNVMHVRSFLMQVESYNIYSITN
ncbi:unnamed protein product [Schistosoma margrebowiei]|uniref:Uncharacterized protein n=1 Tax=Schistosoma margrebowiei TaxID=48269 RepID=A0A183NAG6_9TREM|nr:unnamed protein product [Schistosoma margrebowiei]